MTLQTCRREQTLSHKRAPSATCFNGGAEQAGAARPSRCLPHILVLRNTPTHSACHRTQWHKEPSPDVCTMVAAHRRGLKLCDASVSQKSKCVNTEWGNPRVDGIDGVQVMILYWISISASVWMVYHFLCLSYLKKRLINKAFRWRIYLKLSKSVPLRTKI